MNKQTYALRVKLASLKDAKKNPCAQTKNTTIRTKEKMRTYEELLQAVIRYIDKHGKTQAVIDRVESMLPDAWSANIIADALDEIASR